MNQMNTPIFFNEQPMTDAQREANAKRRAREIRQAHRRFRRKEIAVAAFSTFYAVQSSAQTTATLPTSNTGISVSTRTPGGVLGSGAYGFSGTTGTVNLNGAQKAVVIWGTGLGIAGNQTLEFTSGSQAIVLNKITAGGRSDFLGTLSTDGSSSVRGLVFVNPNGFNTSNFTFTDLNTGLVLSTRDFLGGSITDAVSANVAMALSSFP
jgi:filamentous hemagglutinin family protein